MDDTNFKTILDKTFNLLEQAIQEKKAENDAPVKLGDPYDTHHGLEAKSDGPKARKDNRMKKQSREL